MGGNHRHTLKLDADEKLTIWKGGKSPALYPAVRALDSDEAHTTRRNVHPSLFQGSKVQALALVSRPGLFKLIQRSNKPQAKRFDRWVRHEVLPQIMDNGGYMTPRQALACYRLHSPQCGCARDGWLAPGNSCTIQARVYVPITEVLTTWIISDSGSLVT